MTDPSAFVRVTEGPHPVVGGLEGALTDFNFGHTETYNHSGTVLADISVFDQRHINVPSFNRRIPYPGAPRHPLLVVREHGCRSAYWAAPVGDGRAEAGCPELQELMQRSIRWCAGPVDVEPRDLPPSIKMTIRGGIDHRHIVLLLHSTVLDDTVAIGYNRATIALRCLPAEIDSCVSLTGGTVVVDDDRQESRLTIERIQPVAAVEITLK